jgi:hypothetical protein
MATGEREVVIAIQKSKFVEGVGKVQDAMKKGKRSKFLSITHKLNSDHDAEFDVC